MLRSSTDLRVKTLEEEEPMNKLFSFVLFALLICGATAFAQTPVATQKEKPALTPQTVVIPAKPKKPAGPAIKPQEDAKTIKHSPSDVKALPQQKIYVADVTTCQIDHDCGNQSFCSSGKCIGMIGHMCTATISCADGLACVNSVCTRP
jgi:hypothetical protein